jgi:hypothetical protein
MLHTKTKPRYDRLSVTQSVGQCVLVSSPFWLSWPDVCYCLTVTVVSLWCALSDERTGLSFASQSLKYLVICQCVHKYLHFMCIVYKVLYLQYTSVQAWYSKLCPINSSLRYHDSLDTWTVVRVTAAKFKLLNKNIRNLNMFKFKFKLYCDWRSVGQFVLVLGPFWGRWPDLKFLWVNISFFFM